MTEQGVIVVKIGGSTLGSHDTAHDTALEDLVTLQTRGYHLVVVHGGGKTISAWLARSDLQTRFVRGLRVTDRETLQVVVAVLAGLVNKELVSALNTLGARAIGLSGVDGGLLRATIRDPDLGYVGEIASVNRSVLELLLQGGYMPVIASVAQDLSPSNEGVSLLNVNADAVAGEIGAAVSAARLIYLTDVAGILDQDGELLSELSPAEAQHLVDRGVVAKGMIPKVAACLKALESIPFAQIIDGRRPHVLLDILAGQTNGTTIRTHSEGKAEASPLSHQVSEIRTREGKRL